jgi:hypothetical protein
MKIVHWTLGNGSGLHKLCVDISETEKLSGLDSIVIPTVGVSGDEWEKGVDADIQVIHSHYPDNIRSKSKAKTVFIPHGTPENCFQGAVEQWSHHGYVAGNAFMLSEYWLKEADATVTFWPRHQWLWQSLTSIKNKVRLIPMGVDKDIWTPVETKGKWAGKPSLFTVENCHYIKWPYDLFIAWPDVVKEIREARLHVHYLPNDQHRFWYPLLNANGSLYTSYTSSNYYDKAELRNCFVSSDYYVSLVRYGDFNKTCLEAKASGAKVISYAGNPYADYWIGEGDQRVMADTLLSILKGDISQREAEPVPHIHDTVKALIEIYKEIL